MTTQVPAGWDYSFKSVPNEWFYSSFKSVPNEWFYSTVP